MSDRELNELKTLLSKFYAQKATLAADEIWDEKGLSDGDMDIWLNESH